MDDIKSSDDEFEDANPELLRLQTEKEIQGIELRRFEHLLETKTLENFEVVEKVILMENEYKHQLLASEAENTETSRSVHDIKSKMQHYHEKCSKMEEELAKRSEMMDSSAAIAQQNLKSVTLSFETALKCLEDEKKSSHDMRSIMSELHKQLDSATEANKTLIGEISLLTEAWKNTKHELDIKSEEWYKVETSLTDYSVKVNRSYRELWNAVRGFKQQFNDVRSSTQQDLSTMRSQLLLSNRKISSTLFGAFRDFTTDTNDLSSTEEIKQTIETFISQQSTYQEDKSELLGRIHGLSSENERLQVLVTEKNKLISTINEGAKAEKDRSESLNDDLNQTLGESNHLLELFYKSMKDIGEIILSNVDDVDHDVSSSRRQFSQSTPRSSYIHSSPMKSPLFNTSFRSITNYEHSEKLARSTIMSVDRVINKQNGQIKSLEEQLQSANKKLNNLETERGDALKLNKSLGLENVEIKADISKIKTDLELSVQSKSILEERTKDLTLKEADLFAENERLKSQFRELEERVHESENKCVHIRQELDDTQSKLHSEIKLKNHEKISIEQALKTNKQELHDCTRKLRLNEDSMDSLEKEKCSLDGELQKVKSQNLSFEQNIMELKSELSADKTTIDKLNVELTVAQQDFSELSDNNLQLTNDLKMCQKDMDSVKLEKKKLGQNYESLNSDNNDNVEKISVLSNKIKELDSKITSLEKKIMDVTSEKYQLKLNLDNIDREKTSIFTNSLETSAALVKQKGICANFQAERDLIGKENGEIKQQLHLLKIENEKTLKTCESNAARKDELEVLLFELHRQKVDVDNQVLNLSEELQQLTIERDVLLNEKKMMEEKADFCEAELASFKKESRSKVESITNSYEEDRKDLEKKYESQIEKIFSENEATILKIEATHKSQVSLLEDEAASERTMLENEVLMLKNDHEALVEDHDFQFREAGEVKQQKIRELREGYEIAEKKLNEQEITYGEQLQSYKIELSMKNKDVELSKSRAQTSEANLKELNEKYQILHQNYDEKVNEMNLKVQLLESEKVEISELLNTRSGELKSHENMVANLKEKVLAMNTEISGLETNKNLVEDQFTKSSAYSSELIEKLEDKSKNVDDYKLKIKTMDEKLHEFKNKLDNDDKQIKSLEMNKTSLTKDLANVKNVLRDVEKSRLETRRELIELKRKFSLLEVENRNQESQIRELKNLKIIEDRNEETAQKQLRLLKQKLLEQEAMAETSQKETMNYRSKIGDLESHMNMKCKDLKMALEESIVSEKRAASECRQLEDQILSCRDENANLTLVLSRAEGQINAMTENLAYLEDVKKELETKLNELQTALRSTLGLNLVQSGASPSTSFEIHPEAVRSSLQDFTARLRNAETHREKWRTQTQELQKELQSLNSENSQCIGRLSSLKTSLTETKTENITLNGQLKSARNAVKRQESSVKNLESENKTLHDKIARLEQSFEVAKTERDHRKDDISKLKAMETKLKQEVSNQRQALGNAQSVITELQMANAALGEEKDALNITFQDRSTDVQVLKDRMNSMNRATVHLEEKNLTLEITVDRLNSILSKSSVDQTQLKDQMLDLNKSLSESSTSANDLKRKLQDVKELLRMSENDRVALHKNLMATQKRVIEIESHQKGTGNEISDLRREVAFKDERIKDLISEQEELHKIMTDGNESVRSYLLKIKILENEKKALQDQVLQIKQELHGIRRDKKISEKCQSILEKDKNNLEKTVNKMEKDRLTSLKTTIPSELEMQELKKQNQNLMAKLHESDQYHTQKILEFMTKHKHELELSSKRFKTCQDNCTKLMENREESHRERILELENKIQQLREGLQEEIQKRRMYISKSLEAGKEIKKIRTTLFSSLNNASSLDPKKLNHEIERLDGTVERYLNQSSISINTPSPLKSGASSINNSSIFHSRRSHSTPSKKARAQLFK